MLTKHLLKHSVIIIRKQWVRLVLNLRNKKATVKWWWYKRYWNNSQKTICRRWNRK